MTSKCGQVYVIVRNRKGMPSAHRMHLLLKRPLFNLLRQKYRDFDGMVRQKVVILNGDLELPDCGLTGADHQMLCAHLNYIIHSAANTSFSDPLHTLLRNNYWVCFDSAVPGMSDLICPMMQSGACIFCGLSADHSVVNHCLHRYSKLDMLQLQCSKALLISASRHSSTELCSSRSDLMHLVVMRRWT